MSSIVTVRDIAGRIGVAPSTISRALAGDPRVSKERIEEVRHLARKMGYQPKPMRRKHARALGVIATESADQGSNEYIYRVMHLASHAAAMRNHHIQLHFIKATGRNPIPEMVQENRVDGVLLAGHPDESFCRALAKAGTPAVVINDTVARTGFSCVLSNPRAATQEAIQRLVDLGHRRIGFTYRTLEYPSMRRRYDAVRDGLAHAGVKLDPDLILEGVRPTMKDGEEVLDRFAATEGGMPTAVICASEGTALGLLCALLRRGKDVPEGCSLMALGENSAATNMQPQLTTVNPMTKEIVGEAVELLLNQIQDPHHEIIQRDIVSDLNWRESCAEAPVG